MWLADHGTSGPEVVLAVGVAPSRRWAEQWYGLVVAVAPSCSPHAVLPAVVLAVVLAVARPWISRSQWMSQQNAWPAGQVL